VNRPHVTPISTVDSSLPWLEFWYHISCGRLCPQHFSVFGGCSQVEPIEVPKAFTSIKSRLTFEQAIALFILPCAKSI